VRTTFTTPPSFEHLPLTDSRGFTAGTGHRVYHIHLDFQFLCQTGYMRPESQTFEASGSTGSKQMIVQRLNNVSLRICNTGPMNGGSDRFELCLMRTTHRSESAKVESYV